MKNTMNEKELMNVNGGFEGIPFPEDDPRLKEILDEIIDREAVKKHAEELLRREGTVIGTVPVLG